VLSQHAGSGTGKTVRSLVHCANYPQLPLQLPPELQPPEPQPPPSASGLLLGTFTVSETACAIVLEI
jgi:hypothetical protein